MGLDLAVSQIYNQPFVVQRALQTPKYIDREPWSTSGF